jgi:hypothetical protein
VHGRALRGKLTISLAHTPSQGDMLGWMMMRILSNLKAYVVLQHRLELFSEEQCPKTMKSVEERWKIYVIGLLKIIMRVREMRQQQDFI